jgi:Chlorophyllase enzyme/PEP-CTERM motif
MMSTIFSVKALPVKAVSVRAIATIGATVTLTTTLSAIALPGVAASFTPAPQFTSTSVYSTVNPVNNDPTDIYFPNPIDLPTSNYSFPVALFLQGALVDKSFYSEYARQVASYGFIVVVPNHLRVLAPNLPPLLAPETSQIDAVLTQLAAENSSTTSPIAGRIDSQNLGLLGHSFGAAVGLSAIGNLCPVGLCVGSFDRPDNIRAGAFFGANLRDQVTQEFLPIANDGIAVALLQGDLDGRALPSRAETTYNNIATPPKALLTLEGINHFGITNVGAPAGAVPDPIAQTLPQNTSIATTARWSALFLRANMLNDPAAFDYVFNSGDALDPNVSVSEAAVPEPTTMLGVAASGILFGWARRKALRKSQNHR